MAVSNLMSPLLWQSTPYGDPDAWLDFLGVHWQWHVAISHVAKTRLVAIDDLRWGQLLRHAQMHQDEAKALGVSAAYDLVSADLRERDSYSGWMQTHSLDTDRLRQAAGL